MPRSAWRSASTRAPSYCERLSGIHPIPVPTNGNCHIRVNKEIAPFRGWGATGMGRSVYSLHLDVSQRALVDRRPNAFLIRASWRRDRAQSPDQSSQVCASTLHCDRHQESRPRGVERSDSYVVRLPSMASQASSAWANVWNGEPMTFTAHLF